MRKKSSFKNILILALILASPGFCYYLLANYGKNRYKPLTIFGPKIVANTTHKVMGKEIPDTIYHQIPDFKLEDEHGKQVALADFDDKVVVVNFFYTNCPSVCDRIIENMAKLADIYKKNDRVRFLSITVDPERDSVGLLNRYAEKFNLEGKHWQFLTGDTATINLLARKGFMVNAVQGDPNKNDFIYSEKITLVDSHKRIRGYYSGVDKDDVTRLTDEIKVLIAEELRNIKIPD